MLSALNFASIKTCCTAPHCRSLISRKIWGKSSGAKSALSTIRTIGTSLARLLFSGKRLAWRWRRRIFRRDGRDRRGRHVKRPARHRLRVIDIRPPVPLEQVDVCAFNRHRFKPLSGQPSCLMSHPRSGPEPEQCLPRQQERHQELRSLLTSFPGPRRMLSLSHHR